MPKRHAVRYLNLSALRAAGNDPLEAVAAAATVTKLLHPERVAKLAAAERRKRLHGRRAA